MSVFSFRDLLIDVSALESRHGIDASRWAGRVRISQGDRLATANWKGAEGSRRGMLFDVEGEDESFCETIDVMIAAISAEIEHRLGDPCSPEERRDLARRADWFDEGAERAGRAA